MTHDHRIFDRKRLHLHRKRAAQTVQAADFLWRQCAERLADRLQDMGEPFPVALDLGAHHGLLKEYLPARCAITMLVQADLSQAMLRPVQGLKVVCDEEFLPFTDNSFDLVISVFSLHWINDLPGTLVQINRILKPGGLMIAMLPGVETLKELRQSFEQAELAVMSGIGPRISPFVDARDGAGLLQRVGFTQPVADSEILTIRYETPMKLLEDLRATGETNTLLTSPKGFLRRSVLTAAMGYYAAHFSGGDGRIAATCEIVTLTGWKAYNSLPIRGRAGEGAL